MNENKMAFLIATMFFAAILIGLFMKAQPNDLISRIVMEESK